jgi:hypothetical protein
VQLKTEILKPVWVSLTVKSFEKPVVFWMKSCGGKLSTWFVKEMVLKSLFSIAPKFCFEIKLACLNYKYRIWIYFAYNNE